MRLRGFCVFSRSRRCEDLISTMCWVSRCMRTIQPLGLFQPWCTAKGSIALGALNQVCSPPPEGGELNPSSIEGSPVVWIDVRRPVQHKARGLPDETEGLMSYPEGGCPMSPGT